MKKNISIALLILINLLFILLFILYIAFTFGLFIVPFGPEKAIELADTYGSNILIRGTISIIIVTVINYFILSKLIKPAKPLMITTIIGALSIIILPAVYFSSKHSFIQYHTDNAQFRHFYKTNEIIKVLLISKDGNDTCEIRQFPKFLRQLSNSKIIKDTIPVQPTHTLVLFTISGKQESLLTNGTMFGPYQHKWFAINNNLVAEFCE